MNKFNKRLTLLLLILLPVAFVVGAVVTQLELTNMAACRSVQTLLAAGTIIDPSGVQ